MPRVQPFPAASILGLVIAVAGGCGNQNSSDYRTYTPPPDEAAARQPSDAPPVAVPPVAAATEPSPLTDNGVPRSPATSETSAVADPTPVPPTAAADATPTAVETVESAADAVSDNGVESPAAVDAESIPDSEIASAAEQPSSELLAAVGATSLPPAEPRETKLLIPEKSFRKEGDALRVSYDDIDLLKVLNMEPVTADAPDHLPAWLNHLDGQRIRIRGYMRPGELSENLPFFVLARDTQACCFGPNTKSYDIIPVVMRDGVTTDYIHLRPFDLVGVFHINVEMDLDDPNKVEFLYYIDDAVLIEK